MTYGDKRDYRIIEIFVNGKYQASTTWAKTCREAKARYLAAHPTIAAETVKTLFAKS